MQCLVRPVKAGSPVAPSASQTPYNRLPHNFVQSMARGHKDVSSVQYLSVGLGLVQGLPLLPSLTG